MINIIKRFFQSQDSDLPVTVAAEQNEPKSTVFTLDPSIAPVITLPKSYKFVRQTENVSHWPAGFWDHMNKGDSYYKRNWFAKAKDEFLSARLLKNNYDQLNTQLLRTYRKLYKKAIEERHIEDAYNVLLEMFETIQAFVSDTDRKQFNKIINALQTKDPNFKGLPIELQDRAEQINPVRPVQPPLAQILSEEQTTYSLLLSEDKWVRPKDEKPVYWRDTFLTSLGLVRLRTIRNKESGRCESTHIHIQSDSGHVVSDTELPFNFFQMKISKSGNKLIGYTEDLRLFLLSMEGKSISERSISREAEGNKHHIRCVDLDFDGKFALFTSGTQAFFTDCNLNILFTWTMPPPEGYHVEKREAKPIDPNVERALSILELQGTPKSEDIRNQFRRLVLKYHPDKNPDDPEANEKTKLIIWAFRILASEDLKAALAGIDNIEYYYRIMDESTIELKDFGISLKLTTSISGNGDWIYASCISAKTDRIFLGCYSGRIYCVSKEGIVLKTYVTDDTIRRIEESQGLLYIQTNNGMYIISDDKVLNHVEIGEGELASLTMWGFIIKKGLGLSLYDHDGNLIGNIKFSKELCEIDPLQNGLLAYTRKERIAVSFQKK